MKTLLITLLAITLASAQASAQQKIARYCIVWMQQKAFNATHYNVRLGEWEHKELFSFRDTAILGNLQRVTDLNTPSDVLNYMSANGWTFFQSQGGYNFIFKREFDLSELADTPPRITQ